MALLRSVLDLLYPPKCPFCGGAGMAGQTGPCPRCQDAPFWLEGAQAVVKGRDFVRCACAAWYQEPLRTAVKRFKFSNQPQYAAAYGAVLARTIRTYLPGSYDLLSWVPVSPATLKSRGYDQAQLLAQEAAKVLGQAAVPLLAKTGHNKPQSTLAHGNQRWTNVAGVYTVPHPEGVRGQRVLLLDDILTTGATLNEAARTLRQAGAAQVVCAALCRTPNTVP